RSLLIELNAEGTGYLTLDPNIDDDFIATWDVLRRVFLQAKHELTQKEILSAWPEECPRPSSATLWRWLQQSIASGQVTCLGRGGGRVALRYCLPEKLAEWQDDPIYQFAQMMRANRNSLPEVKYTMPSG